MVREVTTQQTPKEIAEAEIAKENREADVERFKELFRRKRKAQVVLDTIDREIAELEIEMGYVSDQG